MTAGRRRVLFDVNHPAQVHLFRHAVEELQARGHDTLVTSRDKEITIELLDAFGMDHRPLSTERDGTAGLIAEWLAREAKLLSVAREFDPDVTVSRLNPATVHASRVVGCRNIVFTDTVVHSTVRRTLNYGLTIPFVDVLCAPPGFDLPFEPGQFEPIGFHELAYLHPDRFELDSGELRRQGVDPAAPYSVLRFAGWDAYHDVGNSGWSAAGKRDLVDALAEHGDVYVTSEDPLPPAVAEYELDVPPETIHDLLAFADLYVGDSQTMPTEAALLGTPAIRVNSTVGEDAMHNFVELERRGLLFSYRDERRAIDAARSVLSTDDADWERKRRELVADERDVTGVMLDLILDATDEEAEPASVRVG